MSLARLYDVAAPAKLNLFLHIVGRRPDGYHLLQSLFVLIDWCDTLHFECRADGQLTRHDLGPALPADDLCLRAARLLQAEANCALGADISIDKRVPWGAGLGGGSSDAASTLLALNQLWGLRWPRSRLLPLALQLGADVPFFLGGRNAFVEGIGEQLTPMAMAPMRLAVVKPPAGIETRALFTSPLVTRNTEPVIIAGSFAGTGQFCSGFGSNDLQHAAQAVCPEVAEAAALLNAAFGNSRMTGSGSAVFAHVGEAGRWSGDAREDTTEGARERAREGAREGANQLSAAMPVLPMGWQGRMCSSLHEHPLVGWAPA